MAGVGGEVDRDLVTGLRGVGALAAEVVLHVAGPHDGIDSAAFELTEDLCVPLAGDVGQDVEPAAVRHTDGDLVELGLRRGLEDLVEHGDRGLRALEGEALLAHVLGLQEGLERLGCVESFEDLHLLLARRRGVGPLHVLLDPVTLFRVLDVHVLHADGAAVRVTQNAENGP